MKTLMAGIVLIVLVGVAGFFYRNALERPLPAGPGVVGCTMEAKMCPDGSAVGRTGPNCEFTPCAYPNVEVPGAGVAFGVPAGYSENPNAYELRLVANYIKPSASPSVSHVIDIRLYPITEGKTGTDIILANTTFSPSGEPATDMGKFKPVVVNGRTFQSVVIERFEGQVESAYYLVRANDVLRFSILEHDVDWTNPDLVIPNLPEHKALLEMLSTLQTP